MPQLPRTRSTWRAALLAGAAWPLAALPAMAEDALVLSPIIVEGGDGAVTEDTGAYATERVTVGGKQPSAIRDIPQTVSVITRQALDDAGANSIEEASYLLPGLTNATGDGFVGSLYARGQEVFQYYVDGAPRPYLSIYGTAPDLWFFDRMEVMHGPSGVFQGSGEPVGTLNLVRKRAPEETQIRLGASFDTLGGYRAQADAGGALSESGRFRGRVALYGEHQGSFVDITEADSAGIYGTLEADLTPDTTLSVGLIAERTDTVRHSGLPTYADGSLLNVSASTFIGSPDNNADIPTTEAFVEIEHVLDGGGVIKASGRLYEQSAELRNLLSSTAVDNATGDFDVFWFARDFEQTAWYGDLNITQPLRLGGIDATITAGADYRRSEQTFKQNFDFSPGTANIATFDPNAYALPAISFPGVGPGFRLNTETETGEFGAYAQARAEVFDGLRLNLGARFSVYDSEVTDTGRGTSSSISETNFAPYVGITWDATDQVTLYASYATIFQPQTELQADGSNVKPRHGDQMEAGVKTEFFGGALTAQAAVFRIHDADRAIEDPNNFGFYVGSGEADTHGVELSVAGSPWDGVDLMAGYAFHDTELTTDPTPGHVLTLFGKYTFHDGDLAGLSLGGGMRAFSGFDSRSEGVVISAPGAAVFDLFASYALTDTVTAQVNVANIFDIAYVDRVNTTARGTYYGAPLTATFSISAAF